LAVGTRQRRNEKISTATTALAAKRFIQADPYDNCAAEIEIFCELFMRRLFEKGLRKFVESKDALPYFAPSFWTSNEGTLTPFVAT